MSILKNTDLLGSIDASEMEKIMNAYTLAFFEQYLQGKIAPLLAGPPPAPPFPEVVFTAHQVSSPQPGQ
jgi:hypothetical protein